MKRVRRSLDKKWSAPGDVHLADALVNPETPVSIRYNWHTFFREIISKTKIGCTSIKFASVML